MEDSEIPGSRVRASTGHGTLTVDELASIQPGMSRLMDELGRRYWALFYAAKAGNWELARYLERESEKILKAAGLVRPKYREDLQAFLRDVFEPIDRSIESKDWSSFESAYRHGIDESNRYHEKYKKGFIRFRLPDRPPEWLDFGPR